MTQRPSAYPFVGGLDETTQAMAVPKGRVIGCKNHESTATGYARIRGFERFDGRQGPTDAYGLAPEGFQTIARDSARKAIQKVPGSGPVRGVATFKGVKYAWRDDPNGFTGVMYRATAAGWVPVPMGAQVEFTGGSVEIAEGSTITGATSGATALVRRMVPTGGAVQDGNLVGYLVLSDITGTFVAEDVNVGASLNVATIAGKPIDQTFPPGGRYYTETHNFYGAAVLKEMYGCNGVGRGFAFDGDSVVFIRTGMVIDKPMRLRVFKKHLFFAFPGGSVQHSQPGEPLQWSAVYGAGEIAVGSEIVDLLAGTDALFMFTEDQINYLSGSDASDWVMIPLNNEEGHGAVAHTAATVGKPMYLDVGGLRSISATQDYGNFKLGSMTPQIFPTINTKRRTAVLPVAAVVSKTKDQYRLFYEDGTGISVYFGRKYPEPMLFELPKVVRCACVELDPNTGERFFFGSDDGFVYELDVGTSFDGEPIEAYLQLPWDNEGSFAVLKRWHRVTIEMKATPETTIGMLADFDYGNGNQGTLPKQEFTVSGGSGMWNAANWNEFYWSSPAEGRAEGYFDGEGENMSIVIMSISAEQDAYTLSSIIKRFSVRGQLR